MPSSLAKVNQSNIRKILQRLSGGFKSIINISGVYAGHFFNDQATAGHGVLVETDGIGTGTNAFYVITSKTTAPHVALRILGNGKVGIGAGPSTSTELAIASTTGAFVPPRMTTAQRNALTAINGMVIYNTNNNRNEYRENGAWVYYTPNAA